MPQSVHFFIARNPHEGFELAQKFGWQAIASQRFITPDALDLRLITLPRELNPNCPVGTRVFWHESFYLSDKDEDKKKFQLFEQYADDLHYVMEEIREPETENAN